MKDNNQTTDKSAPYRTMGIDKVEKPTAGKNPVGVKNQTGSDMRGGKK